MKKWPPEAPAEDIIKHILETYGPTKGKLAEKVWRNGVKLAEKYGPTKGKLLYHIIDSLKRLERRYIIKVMGGNYRRSS